MLRRAALVLALGLSIGPLSAAPGEDSVPNSTEQEVRAIFGDQLEQGDRAESLLLLAIAFDHHASKSPTSSEQVGVPYIAETGPGFWVRLLQQERDNPSLSTLVNNALILLFTADTTYPIEVRRKAASELLVVAADRGYWPAQVYLAERLLREWEQEDEPVIAKGERAPEVERAFKYLSQCSRIGFAPCQFRLGFWYVNTPTTRSGGVELLRAGVEVVRRDRRYMDSEEALNDFELALETIAKVEPGQAYKDLLAEYRARAQEQPE